MDYTTIERVHQELHIQTASGSSMDDGLLGTLITAASRAWDRKCTGAPDGNNYFETEDVTDEILVGQINHLGQEIICYPHKPIINSVSSFTFQENITKTAYVVETSRIDLRGPKIIAYPSGMPIRFPSRCRVTISYNGGLGESVDELPPDMVEAVTILAIRFYREAETGLSDQIGVAELSTMIYTKAWPIRVTDLLQVYKRKAGWRLIG